MVIFWKSSTLNGRKLQSHPAVPPPLTSSKFRERLSPLSFPKKSASTLSTSLSPSTFSPLFSSRGDGSAHASPSRASARSECGGGSANYAAPGTHPAQRRSKSAGSRGVTPAAQAHSVISTLRSRKKGPTGSSAFRLPPAWKTHIAGWGASWKQ